MLSRGQAGLEYAFLLAVVLMATLSLAYFSFQESSSSTRVSQVELAVKQLADAADLVYANGVGAKTTVRVYVPGGINASIMGGREVLYRAYATQGELVDVYRVTQANLTPTTLPSVESVYSFSVEFLANGNVSIYNVLESPVTATPTPTPIPTPTPTPTPDPGTPPLYFNNQTNDTEAGTPVLFSLSWADNIALANYTFSFDNGTGSFANDSVVSFSGMSNHSNATKYVNQSTGSSIRWIAYAQDAAANANVSQTYGFRTCGAVDSRNEAAGNALSSGFFNNSIDSQSKAAYLRWNNCSKFGGYNFTQAYYHSPVYVLNHSNARNVSSLNWTWFQAATAGNATASAFAGPQLSLHFENDSKDSSRHNNTGKAVGNTTASMYDASCQVGGCLSFDGSNDYVDLGANRNLVRNSRAATLSAWVRPRAVAGGEDYVIGISVGSASATAVSRAALVLASSNEFRVIARAGDGESSQTVTTTSSSISLNSWHHVVGVINYANDNITLYVNGVAQPTSGSASFIATSTSDTPSRSNAVGSEDDGSGSFFDGWIDEAHAWNYALGAAQVASLYSLENAGRFDHNTTNVTLQARTKQYSFNNSGLVGWWDLGDEEGVGSDPINKTLDLSGNGNDLNLGNATMKTQPLLNSTHCVIGNCFNFTTWSNTQSHAIRNPFPNFPTTAVTVAEWVKPNAGNQGTIFSYAVSGTHNEFRIEDVNNIELLVNGNGQLTGVSVADNQWHHVAFTWRSSDGQAILYRDGVVAYQATMQAGSPITTGGSLVLGQDQDTVGNSFDPTQAFQGLMDDVKVWNRTLSSTEISRLYNSRAPVSSTGLERNWTAYTSELGGGSVDNVTPSVAAGRLLQYRAVLKADANRSYSPFFLGANFTTSHYENTTVPPIKALATYFDSGSVNDVRFRSYDSDNGWTAEANAESPSTNTRPKHVLRASPTRNEMVLVTQDTSFNIKAQVWNGSGWNNLTTLSSAGAVSDVFRSFDVAYEESSGDAVVAYRKSSDTVTPYYRVWNGSAWGVEGSAGSFGAGNNIEWLKLVAKNNSDELLLAGNTNTDDVYAQAWSGSSWGSVTAVETSATCTYQCFDLAYERSSGEALIVYRDGNSNTPRYRTYSSGSWGAEASANDVGGRPAWVRLASDPTSDRVVLAVLDESSDLNTQAWSGSAWGSNSELENNMESENERGFDIAFQANGTALLVYGESGVETPRYRRYTNPTWGSEQSAPNVDGDISWVALAANSTGNEIMSMIVDNENFDLFITKWVGASWSELTTVETSAYATYESFAIAYRRD